MTKLRLIKPWGLRMVRQHANVILIDRVISPAIQSCSGPVGVCEDAFSHRYHHEIRTVKNVADARIAHRRVAPVVCSSQLSLANVIIR